jgi:translation initiation factor IF-2
MGHVDHGKTSLLDGIRTTDVVAGEAGGITQHIGAYSVQIPSPDNPKETRRVVFLDTPGHEAFTMMRARGAKATDVVVLVVAADDGVMPQTIEAIEHSRAAGVPIVVAINKIDKPDANPDRVKQELSGHGLQPVEWGGETEMVQVSAKKRENLGNLLETILLTADILDLKASPTRLASGVVLEAKLDRGRGAVATVLVQQGTLRIGDPFIVGQIFGKVRAMFNDRGEAVTEVGPATPVEVLGLQGVPQAGESFQVVADVTRAQQISHHRQMLTRQNTLLQTTKRGIEALGQTEVKELLVVIKADVQGSVEVLKSTLQKLSTEQVKVKVVRSGVGAITESDVLLASATQAGSADTAVVIIGFNVRPETRAADLAKQERVDIRLHSIIYKVEEEIRAAMIGMLEAIEKERILGKAEIREIFRVPKAGVVAGSMVIDGTVRRNARARLIRDAVVIWEGGISSLRRFKDDVGEVREGFECGIGLENFNDVKVGDQIEAYIVEKVAATEL